MRPRNNLAKALARLRYTASAGFATFGSTTRRPCNVGRRKESAGGPTGRALCAMGAVGEDAWCDGASEDGGVEDSRRPTHLRHVQHIEQTPAPGPPCAHAMPERSHRQPWASAAPMSAVAPCSHQIKTMQPTKAAVGCIVDESHAHGSSVCHRPTVVR